MTKGDIKKIMMGAQMVATEAHEELCAGEGWAPYGEWSTGVVAAATAVIVAVALTDPDGPVAQALLTDEIDEANQNADPADGPA